MERTDEVRQVREQAEGPLVPDVQLAAAASACSMTDHLRERVWHDYYGPGVSNAIRTGMPEDEAVALALRALAGLEAGLDQKDPLLALIEVTRWYEERLPLPCE